MFKRKNATETPSISEQEKQPHGTVVDDRTDPNKRLHRGLHARQVAMIAIGGAIGTGLIIGTGSALARAGPGSILISYSIVGFVVWLVMCALGEMATWLPCESGFTGYATRFVDPSLGFALGYVYWFKYVITTPNQLTAGALVIQYWVSRDQVNPGIWITVFLVSVLVINYFGIRFFGEIEFWLSSVKVLTLTGLLILSLVLMLGGGPDGDRRGFRYWQDPGAFRSYPPYLAEEGRSNLGNFIGLWSTFVTAAFAYIGTELVGVTVGECENPRRVIPKAIKLTAWRIIIFYICSVLLVGTLVAYNSPSLVSATEASTGASASPFVAAMVDSGINVLPGFLNGCILLFVFSASNSDLYIASRTLYGLAKEGKAPRLFARTNSRGVPVPALLLSSLIACIAYLNVANDSAQVFQYFVNLVTIFGLLAWISILVAHIYFVRARRAQGIPNSQMVYVAPLGEWGSIGALAFSCLIAVTKNFDAFIYVPGRDEEHFDYQTFITGYLGIPLYLCLLFGHKLLVKTKGWKPYEADLYTGKDVIDAEEEAFLEKQKNIIRTGPQRFYDRYISWLF